MRRETLHYLITSNTQRMIIRQAATPKITDVTTPRMNPSWSLRAGPHVDRCIR